MMARAIEQSPALPKWQYGATFTSPNQRVLTSGTTEFTAPSKTFTLPNGVGEVVTDTVTLKFASPAQGVKGVRLGSRFISDVSVRRFSDNMPLQHKTHYEFDPRRGLIWRETGNPEADYAVKVTYKNRPHVFHLIAVDMASKKQVLISGVSRFWDALEYMPECPPDHLPIYWVMQYTDSTINPPRGVLVFTKAHGYSNGVRFDLKAAYDQLVADNRSKVSATLAKAAAGLPITIIIDGDSTANHGKASCNSLNAPYTPQGVAVYDNGVVTRSGDDKCDHVWHFEELEADTIANIPRFPMASDRITTGWHWSIIRALGDKAGSVITAENWACPGKGAKDLTPIARLAEIQSKPIDLTIICVGMNDSFNPNFKDLENHLAQRIASAKAYGSEVFVKAVDYTSLFGGKATAELMEDHNRRIKGVCDAQGVAYFNTGWITHNQAGSSGIPLHALSGGNGFNHIGPKECAVIGSHLRKIFK